MYDLCMFYVGYKITIYLKYNILSIVCVGV